MREIIFDTETTGLDHREDRIIEFGAVELVNRFPTGRSFHLYINPQGRPVHPDALAVHGIGPDKLADKPIFDAVADEIVEFIGDAMLVAHNATFDVNFINAEFDRIGLPALESHRVVDTLMIARRKHPMGPNSLDALCKRYAVDASRRTKHGALLDSELLAEVYIELIGGRQAALALETAVANAVQASAAVTETSYSRPRPLGPRLSESEAEAHRALVAKLGSDAIWMKVPG